MKKIFKKLCYISIVILIIGFLLPEQIVNPVKGATKNDYNPKSFWAYPWGRSITHKGVDIFASKGKDVTAPTNGIVLYAGYGGSLGGNVVLILGAKWRLHYFAHLDKVHARSFEFVTTNSVVGKVGNSGNAKGKPSHLHYSIMTPIPYPWLYDGKAVQGWLKMFYLNPIKVIENK